jgi:hypothetical protein
LVTTVKKLLLFTQQITMANSPVDRNSELMQQEFGTKVLITDLAADKYLKQSAKHGTDRYSKWCGGKGGFDDFAERLH